jgi:transposase
VVHPASYGIIEPSYSEVLTAMPTLTRLRPLTAEELTQLPALAHSRTEPAALVQRAQILCLRRSGQRVPAIAAHLHVCERTVRRWIARFNTDGLAGLRDAPRAGRPPTYTEAQRSTVVATSLTDPRQLQLPFASWTLDRLQAYLTEQQALPIKRSRIAEILASEGLRWRTQERWLTEQAALDPEFAQKRGPSSRSTPPRPPPP